jgi:hypothetical protein
VVENIQVVVEGDLVTVFTIKAMCISYNHHYLWSLAFKVAELNLISHTPNKDRYCQKEMVPGFMRQQPQLSLRQPLAKWRSGQQVSVKVE